MQAVQQFAANGGRALGICNGFQILCEAGLLPGALIRNRSLQFRCEHVFLKTVTVNSPFTSQIPVDKLLRVPIAHGEGCYFADDQTLAQLTTNDQILWRYVSAEGKPTEQANPNGSLDNIAGICNQARNVAGLMPHPERASKTQAWLRSRFRRGSSKSPFDLLRAYGEPIAIEKPAKGCGAGPQNRAPFCRLLISTGNSAGRRQSASV
jgi:phosphoribosylformylglycinamidine synthase I